MTKERYQNPNCGDTINLRLFTYNSNSRRDVKEITQVQIFTIDPTLKSESNPEGLRLVETISGASVVKSNTGEYILSVFLDQEIYGVGSYYDVWNVVFENGDCLSNSINNKFNIYADLWFTTPTPIIYDFNFAFRPNRIRKGTKRYIQIAVTPNVPRGADLLKYYENIAIVSDIKISMEMYCGECVPAENDLRLIIDRHLVDYREDSYAYWFFYTTQYDEGIYNIWFETTSGESTYVSEKYALQIYN
jgi:hypothetical protein